RLGKHPDWILAGCLPSPWVQERSARAQRKQQIKIRLRGGPHSGEALLRRITSQYLQSFRHERGPARTIQPAVIPPARPPRSRRPAPPLQIACAAPEKQ